MAFAGFVPECSCLFATGETRAGPSPTDVSHQVSTACQTPTWDNFLPWCSTSWSPLLKFMKLLWGISLVCQGPSKWSPSIFTFMFNFSLQGKSPENLSLLSQKHSRNLLYSLCSARILPSGEQRGLNSSMGINCKQEPPSSCLKASSTASSHL